MGARCDSGLGLGLGTGRRQLWGCNWKISFPRIVSKHNGAFQVGRAKGGRESVVAETEIGVRVGAGIGGIGTGRGGTYT